MANSNMKGIGFKILNLLIYSLISINLKYLSSQGIGIFQIICISSIFGFLFMNIIARKNNINVFEYKLTKLYVLRGALNTLGLVSWVEALKLIAITDATAISYTTPIIATVLAIIILKEKITLKIMYALLLGFIGMIVIIKPNSVMLMSGVIIAIISSATWAVHDVLVKYQTEKDDWIKQSYYTFLMVACFSSPFAINNWQPVGIINILHIALIGFLSVLNKACLIFAFTNSSLVLLAPISFFRLLFTSIFAYLLFSEVVSIYSVMGTGLIIAATALTVVEGKKKQGLSQI